LREVLNVFVETFELGSDKLFELDMIGAVHTGHRESPVVKTFDKALVGSGGISELYFCFRIHRTIMVTLEVNGKLLRAEVLESIHVRLSPVPVTTLPHTEERS
jgi:hypothetical protein